MLHSDNHNYCIWNLVNNDFDAQSSNNKQKNSWIGWITKNIYINQTLKVENNYKKYHLTNIKHTQWKYTVI